MTLRDTKLSADAGEHYVCSMLARYEWAAALTRDGLARTDILVVNTKTRTMIEVQVKTIRAGMWPLGRKDTQHDLSGREWYVFVKLGPPPGLPETYVVPRDHVAAGMWISHQNWLTDPNVKPGKRNTPLEQTRVGTDIWDAYQDQWDQLEEDTRTVPVLLPGWMRNALELDRVGLPEGHPWNDRQRIPDWPAAASAFQQTR